MNEMDFSKVKRIAIDAKHPVVRGHHYFTLFVDVNTKKVMFAIEVYCDMSPSFIAGVEKYFPKANITFDKFHVMKIVNEPVDQVRKDLQKEVPELKKNKISLTKEQNKLKNYQKQNLVK